jgi:hypothetical protein
MIIGPNTFDLKSSSVWCFEEFDDDSCECQSMGQFLSVGEGTCLLLNQKHKSYRFRVVGVVLSIRNSPLTLH